MDSLDQKAREVFNLLAGADGKISLESWLPWYKANIVHDAPPTVEKSQDNAPSAIETRPVPTKRARKSTSDDEDEEYDEADAEEEEEEAEEDADDDNDDVEWYATPIAKKKSKSGPAGASPSASKSKYQVCSRGVRGSVARSRA